MVSDAFFCVENFPAPNTKIDVAHCASHDTAPCTSRFGILLPPCPICRRIELLVCPSVQLANIHFPCGTTFMCFALVSRCTFIRPRVGERALLSIFGALVLEAEEVVLIGVLGGDFLLGQSSSGSKCTNQIALFQS